MIVQTPPVLIQHDDGRWYLEVLMPGGQESVLAPVGDGAWLVQQMAEKIVLPALRKLHPPVKPRDRRDMTVTEIFNQPYEG